MGKGGVEVALQNKEVSTEAPGKPCAAERTRRRGDTPSMEIWDGLPCSLCACMPGVQSLQHLKILFPSPFPCCHGMGQLQLQPQEVMAIKLRR